MKTKYCDKYCGEDLHTAECLNKRRDAGEFDVEKRLSRLETEVKEFKERIKNLEHSNSFNNNRPIC